jgi:hypothetical protein
MASSKFSIAAIILILILSTLACISNGEYVSQDHNTEETAPPDIKATQTALTVIGEPEPTERLIKPTSGPALPSREDIFPSYDDIYIELGPPGESTFEADRPQLSGNPITLDTIHFRVHYTTNGKDAVPPTDENKNGHPDFVEHVALAVEFAWEAEINHFGWAAPPSDKGLGGDNRYDIYLKNIMTDGTFGYTEGGYLDNIVGDNPNTPIVERNASYSFMVLDNDYSEINEFIDGDVSALDAMRTTSAHEFNHAIQYGYDSKEPSDWLWEATATWMQDEVYDDINDARDVLSAVAKAPDTCQIAEGGKERVEDDLHWYGQWIFLRYISEKFGHAAVRSLWENAVAFDGYLIFNLTLQEYNTDLNSLFKEFTVALLGRNFEEGIDYPAVRLEGEAHNEKVFYPIDGVGQMAADYVKIVAVGQITIRLGNPELSALVAGVTGQEISVFQFSDDLISVNADDFDHLYLIVLNLTRARNERSCRFFDYTIEIFPSSDGSPSPDYILLAPNFLEPEVEGLLDPDAFWEDENHEYIDKDELDENGLFDTIEPPDHLTPSYIPLGYYLFETYLADRTEFGKSEEEIIMWVPGDGPATVLDYYGPEDYDILSIIASSSPYINLEEYLSDIQYVPWENEMVSIGGISVFLQDWSDGDVYTNATFIIDDEFIVISGAISRSEMQKVIKSLVEKKES